MPDDDQDPARTGPDGRARDDDAPDGHAHAHAHAHGDAHDGAHDDDDDGGGPAPEEVARARQALARLRGALAGLDDGSLRRGVETMRERSRAEVAQALNLSRAAIHLGEALAPLVRRKLAAAPPDRQLAVAFALTEAANDATVDALGDRHADPTREDLEAVLPGIIEEHGLPTVRLMVAAYAASDAPVQPVMRALLDTDERFALPDEPPPLAPAEPGLELRRRTPEEEAAQAAKREQRRAAKEARRAAERKRREAAAAGQAARRTQRQRARRAGS